MAVRRSGRIRSALVDSGPVIVLALIAAVGSFTHISELAADHGQKGWQSWAVAVCIDLMCVMAARELQRDKRTGRRRRGLISWPGLVLAGGIVLTLAANLAQAEPSPWGWTCAATPAVAFLVAVSMLERRASHRKAPQPETAPAPAAEAVPVLSAPVEVDTAEPSTDLVPAPAVPSSSAPAAPVPPTPVQVPATGPADALVAYARRIATEHTAKHGTAITCDALRQRLRVSNELAADLLTQIHTTPEPA